MVHVAVGDHAVQHGRAWVDRANVVRQVDQCRTTVRGRYPLEFQVTPVERLVAWCGAAPDVVQVRRQAGRRVVDLPRSVDDDGVLAWDARHHAGKGVALIARVVVGLAHDVHATRHDEDGQVDRVLLQPLYDVFAPGLALGVLALQLARPDPQI